MALSIPTQAICPGRVCPSAINGSGVALQPIPLARVITVPPPEPDLNTRNGAPALRKAIPATETRKKTAYETPILRQADRVNIYSNSHGQWLPGRVLQVVTEPAIADFYDVPVGSLQVQSAAGQKWVMPDLQDTVVQRLRVGYGADNDVKAEVITNFTPYSEKYGRHPQSFVFDKFGRQVRDDGPDSPKRRLQAKWPLRFQDVTYLVGNGILSEQDVRSMFAEGRVEADGLKGLNVVKISKTSSATIEDADISRWADVKVDPVSQGGATILLERVKKVDPPLAPSGPQPQSNSTFLLERTGAGPVLLDRTGPPIVLEQSSSPSLERTGNGPLLLERTGPPIVLEQSSSPSLERTGNGPVLLERTGAPPPEHQSNGPPQLLLERTGNGPPLLDRAGAPPVLERQRDAAASEPQGPRPLLLERTSCGPPSLDRTGNGSPILDRPGNAPMLDRTGAEQPAIDSDSALYPMSTSVNFDMPPILELTGSEPIQPFRGSPAHTSKYPSRRRMSCPLSYQQASCPTSPCSPSTRPSTITRAGTSPSLPIDLGRATTAPALASQALAFPMVRAVTTQVVFTDPASRLIQSGGSIQGFGPTLLQAASPQPSDVQATQDACVTSSPNYITKRFNRSNTSPVEVSNLSRRRVSMS